MHQESETSDGLGLGETIHGTCTYIDTHSGASVDSSVALPFAGELDTYSSRSLRTQSSVHSLPDTAAPIRQPQARSSTLPSILRNGDSYIPRPASSSSANVSVLVPPSPTLSTRSSVHWSPTSLALRDNNPDERSGLTSLALLQSASTSGHRRRDSSFSISTADAPSPWVDPASQTHTQFEDSAYWASSVWEDRKEGEHVEEKSSIHPEINDPISVPPKKKYFDRFFLRAKRLLCTVSVTTEYLPTTRAKHGDYLPTSTAFQCMKCMETFTNRDMTRLHLRVRHKSDFKKMFFRRKVSAPTSNWMQYGFLTSVCPIDTRAID